MDHPVEQEHQSEPFLVSNGGFPNGTVLVVVVQVIAVRTRLSNASFALRLIVLIIQDILVVHPSAPQRNASVLIFNERFPYYYGIASLRCQ